MSKKEKSKKHLKTILKKSLKHGLKSAKATIYTYIGKGCIVVGLIISIVSLIFGLLPITLFGVLLMCVGGIALWRAKKAVGVSRKEVAEDAVEVSRSVYDDFK